MTVRKLIPLLTLAIAGTAFAAPPKSSETMPNGRSIYGVSNAPQAADRVVDVKSVKQLNVTCGETVTFKSGARQFTWRFDVLGHRVVDLKKVAPADFPVDRFLVYVSSNPDERS
jgi:hypothetical protein